jgi:hypothetical protein
MNHQKSLHSCLAGLLALQAVLHATEAGLQRPPHHVCTHSPNPLTNTVSDMDVPFGAVGNMDVPFGAVSNMDVPFGAVSNMDVPFGAVSNMDVPFGAGACTLQLCRFIWCGEYHSAVKVPNCNPPLNKTPTECVPTAQPPCSKPIIPHTIHYGGTSLGNLRVALACEPRRLIPYPPYSSHDGSWSPAV